MDENAGKGKRFSKTTLFEFNSKRMDFSKPRVMGILNLTPDSFYDGGRYFDRAMDQSVKVERWKGAVETMVGEGAYMIDIGAVSTRPGAPEVSPEEEKKRLIPVLMEIRKSFPELIISVDTYRSEIARMAVYEGADIINDISAGTFDSEMIAFIGSSKIPYIMMHIQGTPSTMQIHPHYIDVVSEVYAFLELQVEKLRATGNAQLIVDPGFGFGKTVEHNFQLLDHLDRFQELGLPVLAGLSRKSMINRVLSIKPDLALNGTTVLNTIALLKGADILRVHDVKEAIEAVKLVGQFSVAR
jgi:dihydropteroate synthase